MITKADREVYWYVAIMIAFILSTAAFGAGCFYGAGELAMRTAFASGGVKALGTVLTWLLATVGFGAWITTLFILIRGFR